MFKDENIFLALHRNIKKRKLVFHTLPIIVILSVIGSSFIFNYLIFRLDNTPVEILRFIPKVLYQIIICFI